MHTVIYAPFAISAVLVALSARACRTTTPHRAAWTVLGSMVLAAAASAGALALLAWPLVARDTVVARIGRWNPGDVGAGVPVPLALSVGAFVALVTMAFRVVRALRCLRSEYAETAKLHRGLPSTSSSVVVVDDSRPLAHALARTVLLRGRVIVSTGLLDTLDAEERSAVLAHEHSHLRHGHRVFTAVAALAAAVNPLVAPMRGDLAFVLERWADEDAAARTSRRVAARALAKAALAQLGAARHEIVVSAGAFHLGHLGVVQRVAALNDVDVARHRVAVIWLVALVGIVAVAAVAWGAHDTERLFEALRDR